MLSVNEDFNEKRKGYFTTFYSVTDRCYLEHPVYKISFCYFRQRNVHYSARVLYFAWTLYRIIFNKCAHQKISRLKKRIEKWEKNWTNAGAGNKRGGNKKITVAGAKLFLWLVQWTRSVVKISRDMTVARLCFCYWNAGAHVHARARITRLVKRTGDRERLVSEAKRNLDFYW